MFSFGDKKLLIGLKGFTQSGFLGLNSFRRLKELPGMTWNSRKQGFTLIELLIVIAIIALLSSVVMASLSTARMKARDSKRIADLNQIKLALEMYYDANGKYPPINNLYNVDYAYENSTNAGWNRLATHLAPYISLLPKDPINNVNAPYLVGNYSYSYGNVSDGSDPLKPLNYDLFTQLETPNHQQSCGVIGYKWYYGASNLWCGSYSKQIYEASTL